MPDRNRFINSITDLINAGIYSTEALNEIRLLSMNKLQTANFPTQRDEEWKFISLKELAKEEFHFAQSSDIDHTIISEYLSGEDAHELIFINGYYRDDLSEIGNLPKGVTITTFDKADTNCLDEIETHLGNYAHPENDLFLNINSSTIDNGVLIFVPANTKLEKPIHILNITTDDADAALITPRLLVLAEKFSLFSVIEDFVGISDNSYLSIPVTEMYIGENAHVKHIRVQRESANAYHINRVGTRLEKAAEYESYSIQLGSKLSRNDIKSTISGTECVCTLDGLVLLDGSQVSDTHTVMDHEQPHCNSHQLHKVVVNGEAHSVFNGKIWVQQAAQKTNSFQENRNILLSDTGKVDTKPQLEIFADDVKCSHGATIGQLEEEEVFYLTSRGLTRAKAIELLLTGFAGEVIENIEIEGLRNKLMEEVSNYTLKASQVVNKALV